MTDGRADGQTDRWTDTGDENTLTAEKPKGKNEVGGFLGQRYCFKLHFGVEQHRARITIDQGNKCSNLRCVSRLA